MKEASRGTLPEGVKVLTESEIQHKLYGAYLGRRQKQAPAQVSAAAPVPESTWTGSEILVGELKQLRSDLIALHQEKEQLTSELKKHIRVSEQVRETPREERVSPAPQSAAGFLRRLIVPAVVMGCIGMPFGFRFLQASPVGVEVSPYTVQVAVYDVRAIAEQVLVHLRELEYPAFLVETARLSGRPRYRLYVGRFVTKGEAELQRQRLTADPRFPDAFVRLQ